MEELNKIYENIKKEREEIEKEYELVEKQINMLENKRKVLRDRAIYLEGALDVLRMTLGKNDVQEETSKEKESVNQ